jgi:pyruvate formate lyase activating enzyme
MIIGGYQPLSLIDYPEKIAAIVFTKGCVFRCPYCHNPELVEPESWDGKDAEEFFDFLKRRTHMLDGVVVTGGEPTLHADLPEFIKKIKALGYAVKLDTNGINPKMVRQLIKERLIDYVAMDIKHTWDKYQLVANVKEKNLKLLENCRETMELLRTSDIPYEWRTTVFPAVHEKQDIEEIAASLLPNERYYLQEMRYAVTLKKNLDRSKQLDLPEIVRELQTTYPGLALDTR